MTDRRFDHPSKINFLGSLPIATWANLGDRKQTWNGEKINRIARVNTQANLRKRDSARRKLLFIGSIPIAASTPIK